MALLRQHRFQHAFDFLDAGGIVGRLLANVDFPFLQLGEDIGLCDSAGAGEVEAANQWFFLNYEGDDEPAVRAILGIHSDIVKIALRE